MPTSTCRISRASCSPTATCASWSTGARPVPRSRRRRAAMLKRLRRDISVQIVTTPILDPRTGREREVVDAFTLSYDNREPAKAQKGAQWLVAAFLAEHRRQRQGRASNAAEFYAKEAERIRTHVARPRIQARGIQARQCGPAARADRSQHVDDGSHREPARARTTCSALACARNACSSPRSSSRRAPRARTRAACASSRSSTRACARPTTRAIRTWSRCAGRSTA